MRGQQRKIFFRDIYCPRYDDCLDRAAFGDLDLDCQGCAERSGGSDGELAITYPDIEGCKRLLHVIFSCRNKERRPKG